MARLSQEELQQKLDQAASFVQLGAHYAHYKDPSKTYRVEKFTIIEATNQVGVIYVAEYDKHITFVRPLTSWLDKVDWQGKIVPRFTLVEK